MHLITNKCRKLSTSKVLSPGWFNQPHRSMSSQGQGRTLFKVISQETGCPPPRWRRNGRPSWEGVGYDFVIGNGIDSGDGQVEVTFRWRRQMAGAHCGGTPDNWANEDAVGICLVGNFNYTTPTTQQMQSLLKLVRFLKKRYGISNGSIYGHKNTPGAHVTDCPGHKFPMARLKWLASS